MKRYPARISVAVLAALVIFAGKANAFCPLCAVAAVAGLSLARAFGVDDTVSGVWMGGLITALNLWSLEWLERKDARFAGYKPAVTLVWWLMLLVPLYAMGYIIRPMSSFWGVDKLLLGMFCGGLSFYVCGKWYEKIKAANDGHAQYPFQKVLLPVMPLTWQSISVRR